MLPLLFFLLFAPPPFALYSDRMTHRSFILAVALLASLCSSSEKTTRISARIIT